MDAGCIQKVCGPRLQLIEELSDSTRKKLLRVTGLLNGPVLLCSLASVVCLSSVVVCNAVGGRAGRLFDRVELIKPVLNVCPSVHPQNVSSISMKFCM